VNPIFLTLTLCLISFKGFNQSLINENFENWIDNTAFIDPEGWITLNDLSPEYGLPATVFQTTDAKEGQFAAHMQTYEFRDGNNNIDTLPSIMVYGSDINSGVQYPWSRRLKLISFTYKYKPNGIDSGALYISVGYRDKKTNRMINQGGTYYIFAKREDTYTKVYLPMYYNSNHKCDTFVFAVINSVEKSDGNRCKPGTVLIIDDIDTEWEDFPAVVNITQPEIEFGIFPNPAKDIIFLKGLEPQEYHASFTDLSGKKVMETAGVIDRIDIADLKPGMYILKMNSTNGNFIGSHYFIKN